jgi:hypothetical protein
VAPLRAVAMALWQVDDAASLQALRAAAKKAGAALGVGTDDSQLQELRARLWESLCCVFLQPAEDPRDRAELIRLIRAAELLHEPGTITSLESARRLRRARPVVPRRLLDPVPTPDAPSPGPTNPGGGLEPVPFDPQVLLDQVNGWRKD